MIIRFKQKQMSSKIRCQQVNNKVRRLPQEKKVDGGEQIERNLKTRKNISHNFNNSPCSHCSDQNNVKQKKSNNPIESIFLHATHRFVFLTTFARGRGGVVCAQNKTENKEKTRKKCRLLSLPTFFFTGILSHEKRLLRKNVQNEGTFHPTSFLRIKYEHFGCFGSFLTVKFI